VSILKAYNPAEAIINATHLYQPIAGFPKIALGAFKAIEPLLSAYETEKIVEMRPAGWTCPVWRVRYKGTDIAVYQAMLGGPAAVGAMEKLRAMGAEQFVFYGSCGVLDRDIAAGGIAVPTAAYRDEGTSYHYAPPNESYIAVPTAEHLRLAKPCKRAAQRVAQW
jgi:purine-nucleoside phosphorylase